MGHGRHPVLDGHVRTDEANGPDGQIHVGLGMLLEDSGEHLLDPFTALSGLALFIDDLSVRHEQPRDRLGVSRVVRLGKRLGGEPDRLLVLLMRAGAAGTMRRWSAVAVSGLAGESPDTLFCGPWATAIATNARASPAMIKILRMCFSLSC